MLEAHLVLHGALGTHVGVAERRGRADGKFELGVDGESKTLSGVPGFSELVPDNLQSGLGELKLYAESTIAGSLKERNIDANEVQISVQGDELETSINGSIHDLAGEMNFELGIDATAETLSRVPGISELVPENLQSGLGEMKLYAESTISGSLMVRRHPVINKVPARKRRRRCFNDTMKGINFLKNRKIYPLSICLLLNSMGHVVESVLLTPGAQ